VASVGPRRQTAVMAKQLDPYEVDPPERSDLSRSLGVADEALHAACRAHWSVEEALDLGRWNAVVASAVELAAQATVLAEVARAADRRDASGG
jgi:hypothetical protein